MDDAVFSSQFHALHQAMGRQGVSIEVAYSPSGRADYIYETGLLLARAEVVGQIMDVLPGAGEFHGPPVAEGVVLLDITDLTHGFLTVPQALDRLDGRLNVHGAQEEDRFPLVTPVHILHICRSHPDTVRTCPATEPEAPRGYAPDEQGPPVAPYPPLAPGGGDGTRIGIVDSGLIGGISASAPWLDGVDGEPDDESGSVLPLPNGLSSIPLYYGHGTFVAGVARGQAPNAAMYVASDFVLSGGEREWVIMAKLTEFAAGGPLAADVVNLSAGSYSRNDWPLLSFLHFDGSAITLTAAAGNDATDRPFWPAAFDWAVGVGALGPDQRHRAWFSNYGNWVNAFTLGEGLVNAFATGDYTYQEPPKRPSVQYFDGMARWSGTSFAAPLVAGLIAAEMARTAGTTAGSAAETLKQLAIAQQIFDDGTNANLPVLYPWHP